MSFFPPKEAGSLISKGSGLALGLEKHATPSCEWHPERNIYETLKPLPLTL